MVKAEEDYTSCCHKPQLKPEEINEGTTNDQAAVHEDGKLAAVSSKLIHLTTGLFGEFS